MARGFKACEECTKICVFIHKKQKHQSLVTRFFKVMFGKGYSEVLLLPPKFARKVRDLEGIETELEDTNGEKWPVKISSINGSLAFQEGWPQFFRDHHLELGDFLVFNYINGSHFVVHAFGTNAREITDFDRRALTRRNKKSRKNRETGGGEETTDVDFTEKPSPTTTVASGSGLNDPTAANAWNSDREFERLQQVVPQASMNMEEDLILILDRDNGCYRENLLYDLSSFENKDESDAKKNEKGLETSPGLANIMQKIEANGDDAPIDIIQTCEIGGICIDKFRNEVRDGSDLTKGVMADASNSENNERSGTVPAGNNCVLPPDINSLSTGNTQIDEQEPAVRPKFFNSSDSSSLQKDQIGKPVGVKKELVELAEQTPGFPQVFFGKHPIGSSVSSPFVKTEPDLPDNTSPQVFAFSAEVKSLSYLEIPVSIPLAPKRGAETRGRVVYLRDPVGRMWPTLYTDSFYRALFDEWSNFCKDNLINPGDVCQFQLQTSDPYIYRVDIIRRP